MGTDWKQRFAELAEYVSSYSKDRNTKVGAVVTDSDKTELVTGYNGFPRGADDDKDERHERPLKYSWTEHAERNAIFKAARKGIALKGGAMYVTYFPCPDCSRGIIQAGITEIIAPKPDLTHERWGKSWKISIEMLTECGVTITYQ